MACRSKMAYSLCIYSEYSLTFQLIKDPLSLTVMHRGQTTESWTTKQPFFYTDAWFQRKSASIVLFAVSFRSCLVFSNSAVSLLVLLLFCGKVLMIWSTECRGQNGKKNWWKFSCENLSTLCEKARRTSQGYGNNTNSEFAEFLLHRESSASSPHNGNSNNRASRGDKLGVGWYIISCK